MINERRHINDNGFVSQYWYDADGERTVKTSGDGEVVYVNSLFSGGNTQTAKFSLYVNPYLVASQGGRYTKHIYIGSQRIVSKLGDLQSYGADPRRIPYAGSESDNITVDYKGKYAQQQQSIKNNYKDFDVPYNGVDNDNYVDGDGFCCSDNGATTRSLNPGQNDNYELAQFYYHPDHLGSSSFITNLDGDVTQHIEYVPFGEVFIEERNNVWNTPYLFNAKELDEETGLYYYGARYYDSRVSLWLNVDPLAEKYPDLSSYAYCHNNPVNLIDPDGRDVWEINNRGKVVNHIEDETKDAFYMVDKKGNRIDGKELSFKYGTIENYQSQYSDEAKTTFDWYNVRSDENGTQLFEFFANNTTVEFSQLMLGQKGNNGLNIISTSHEKNKERSVNFLLESQYKYGYTIRGHNHNHPSNTPYPSGLDTRSSDIGFSNNLTNISLKNGSSVPTFKIYLPKTEKYIKYNRNSTYKDFPNALPVINLPEINIVAPRKK